MSASTLTECVDGSVVSTPDVEAVVGVVQSEVWHDALDVQKLHNPFHGAALHHLKTGCARARPFRCTFHAVTQAASKSKQSKEETPTRVQRNHSPVSVSPQ